MVLHIGVFDLEIEDQKLLVKRVLLRELKKLESVVDKMKTLGEECTRNDQQRSLNWYEVAGCKMLAEVHDTLRQIEEFGTSNTK